MTGEQRTYPGKKRGVKHSPAQREQRRAIVAQLSLKYRGRLKITEKLNELHPDLAVSASQVGKDIIHAEKKWQKTYVDAIQTQKVKELQELLELRQIAWERHEASVGKTQIITREGKKPENDGDPIKNAKITIREEILNGDPRWVAQLIEIDKQIRALMGLDAPQQFEFAGKGGGPIKHDATFSFDEFANAFAAIAEANGNRVEDPAKDGNGKSLDPKQSEGIGIP